LVVQYRPSVSIRKGGQILREALKTHFVSEKIWQEIRACGEETAKLLGLKNEKGVNRLVHELRKDIANSR